MDRRTDWLSRMEHLRSWAHTATTLCRYSGPCHPGVWGLERSRRGQVVLGWDGSGGAGVRYTLGVLWSCSTGYRPIRCWMHAYPCIYMTGGSGRMVR